MENFHRVNENLYRGGSPTPEDIKILKNKFGIKKIVCLDMGVANNIMLSCALLGIELLIFPIDIEKKITLIPFLKNIPEVFKLDVPTVICCVRGRDRTGTAIAIYRCQFEGWSYEDAKEEALKYGFGQGLPKEITSLFLRVIKDHCAEKEIEDVNNVYDIVSNQREYPSDYQDYTLDAWEQQSWGPYSDYRVRSYPFSPVELRNYDSSDDTRQNHGLNDLDLDTSWLDEDRTRDVQVGQYNDSGPAISGLGPSSISGGFV